MGVSFLSIDFILFLGMRRSFIGHLRATRILEKRDWRVASDVQKSIELAHGLVIESDRTSDKAANCQSIQSAHDLYSGKQFHLPGLVDGSNNGSGILGIVREGMQDFGHFRSGHGVESTSRLIQN
ncbi:hypothetical protein QCA50_007620 [Cerrena zonata]|uniref:Uncharacterized protein n=1 Tax=Cerrena zonata TaxID=2478898 RepID=A0AAW0GGG3_9APHY